MKKTKLWKRIAGWLLVFLLSITASGKCICRRLEWLMRPYTSEETDLAGEQDISGRRVISCR